MNTAFALAGRRIDAADADPRFSLGNIEPVRRALRELFESHGASALFCAAACGADLLALEVAQALNVPAWIVLPFPPALFRESSVIDRPGDWGERFDTQLRIAENAGRLIAHALPPGQDSTYLQANEAILDAAEQHAADKPRAAVIAWEGKPRQGIDVTYAFAQSARARGLPVLEIDTRG